MIIIKNVSSSTKMGISQSEKTEAKKPAEGYKRIFEKCISVKNNAIAYLTHAKTCYAKSIKHLISSIKLVRSDKRRSGASLQSEDDGIVLLSCKPILDAHEQFENDMAEQLTKLKEDFQEKIKDEKYKEQVIDAIFSAMYRDVKTSFKIHYFHNKPGVLGENESSLPREYLKTMGQAAYDWGVACYEKEGIYFPKGEGANPLLNAVLSILQKNNPIATRDQKNIERINREINVMVDAYCTAHGLKSPVAFESALIDINKNWQLYINKDNSTEA
ncbi:hypothetical protein [Sodalis ligni]|uniref:SopE GEF domain-containing protein n=1 Tax=Sodalis ligni TaxID=2697027 RepID=A0A4R1NMY8_9GAMM|nr:hypothetical protein [Sodalis ligni]TCL05640.1 SopE GEF domain-containing protein [Sodalis ligni]